MTNVALLGTGTMGAGMARAMRGAGLAVRAWNRTRSKAEPLADDGVTVCDTAREAVDGVDVVVVMLFDADAVLSVLGDAGPAAADAVWLQCSTVGIEGSDRIAAFAREHDLKVLDTPVLGTKKPAEDGALVVLGAGDPALRDAAQPVLDAIGGRTIWVGEEYGGGSRLKLVCNSWIGSITAALGQAVSLARGLDLDPQLFLDAIGGGASDTPYAQVKGKAMIAGEYPVSFQLDGVRKDLGLIRAAAADHGVSTEVLDAVLGVYDQASERGRGGDDMAAVVEGFRAG